MKTIICLVAAMILAETSLPAQQQAQPQPKRPVPTWLTPDLMHEDYESRVIRSPGFGVSRMPAVFQSFTELKLDNQTFRVSRVGLVGIAEHPSPVAFISPREIPNLADLTNATFRARMKMRPLTSFETNALPQLQAGKNVVVDLKAGLVVGAMRAREDCLKCHNGKVGTLLGALSYVLTPAPGDAEIKRLSLLTR